MPGTVSDIVNAIRPSWYAESQGNLMMYTERRGKKLKNE